MERIGRGVAAIRRGVRRKGTALVLGWAVALGAGPAPMALAQAEQAALPARIETTGVGRVALRPDMATIQLGATAESATAAEAMDEVSRRVAGLLEQMRAAGIEARDIQTSGVSLNPVWSNGSMPQDPPRITGFAASNMVTVRVRDLSSLGGVLDSALKAGGNTFAGLSFGLQDPRPAEDEARRLAVADARAVAELLADAAGVGLGPVRLITEDAGGGGPMPYFRADAAMMAEAVPVAEGEIDVVRRVRIEWAISQP